MKSQAHNPNTINWRMIPRSVPSLVPWYFRSWSFVDDDDDVEKVADGTNPAAEGGLVVIVATNDLVETTGANAEMKVVVEREMMAKASTGFFISFIILCGSL